MTKKNLIISFALAFLVACYSEKKTDKGLNILSKEQTSDVLYALTLYEAYLNSGTSHPALADTTLRISPFQQYNVRPAQFDSSLKYYAQIPEDLQFIHESVIEKINSLRENDK